MFRKLFSFIMLISVVPLLAAQGNGSLSFHLRPGADIPVGPKSSLTTEDAPYKLGGSTGLVGQYNLPWLEDLFLEGILQVGLHPTQAQNMLTLGSAGMGIGYDLRLLDRVSLQFGIQGGGTLGFFGDAEPAGNPYAGANLGVTFDLSPGFALSLGSTYSYHLGWDAANAAYTDLYQGVNVWAGTIFRVQPQSGRQKLLVETVKTEPLFPVFFGHYQNTPFGRVLVQNHENSSITNVDVYFFISEYMEQPVLTATYPSLQRNQSVEAPLTALFTSRLLNITESTKVSSEVRIEYSYLGKRFTYTQPLTLTVLDRNSMTWDDDRKAASFVTPRDPTVLIFSKNTAGLVRDQGNNPLNLNFRIAMGLFEALRLYGLNYVIDPQSSFIEASQDQFFLDYLQFPSQTLVYRAGDCDDMSILYAALLESVGIETAFITIPGHIFMAFSLGTSEAETRRNFSSADNFIYIDDKAWVPIEITLVQDGFMKALSTGIKQWRDAVNKNANGFYPIHTAWETYQPVGFNQGSLSLLFPSADSIIQGYKSSLDAFVSQEIQSRIDNFESLIRSGGDKANVRNSYGILYARYGLFQKAEEQFLTALRMDRNFANAMVNLANLYFLEERMDDALEWYLKADRLMPGNQIVIAGLARTRYEREEYQLAQDEYRELAALNPELAAKYSYIGNTNLSIVRAASARDKGETFWEGEE